jgi:hypothetical protein
MSATPTYEIIATKPIAEIVELWHYAIAGNVDDNAFCDVYDALYRRVFRQRNPNGYWVRGERRESDILAIVHAHLDGRG